MIVAVLKLDCFKDRLGLVGEESTPNLFLETSRVVVGTFYWRLES